MVGDKATRWAHCRASPRGKLLGGIEVYVLQHLSLAASRERHQQVYSTRRMSQLNSELRLCPHWRRSRLLSRIGVKGLVVHTDQLDARGSCIGGKMPTLQLSAWKRWRALGRTSCISFCPSKRRLSQDLALAMLDRLPNGEVMRLPAGVTMRFGLLVRKQGPAVFGSIHLHLDGRRCRSGGRKCKQGEVTHTAAEGGIAFSPQSRGGLVDWSADQNPSLAGAI